MKIKHIVIACLAGLSTGLSMTSCEDMLDMNTGDKSTVNANDTLYSYLGILKNVQNLAEREVVLNELRGDLISPTNYMTDTLHAIANFDDPADGSCSMLNIKDYYAVINNCNLYLHNADTMAIKNNKKYMIPEYAQVQAIRAWTYLKLVETYGEVPYITEPINSFDVIKNFDYQANLVNKDQLVDRIVADGLTRFVDTDYPSYGNYNNGSVSINSRLCYFPVRLILGDLYLLRGRDESDYQTAARYYYEYLRNTSAPMQRAYVTSSKIRYIGISTRNSYNYNNINSWGVFGMNYSSTTDEVITIIPSSANKQFGTMLTRIADIYGYTPTSSQNTETGTDDDGNETSNSSGAISVTYNHESQTKPSNGYTNLSNDQTYVYWNTNTQEREDYDCGDARKHYSTEEFRYDGDAYTLVGKAARSNMFFYAVPVYRKAVVWLRLAEAINRAGYPQLAFGILKDGLNEYSMPNTNATRTDITIRTDENGEIVRDENGQIVRDTTIVNYTRYATNGALHYADSTQIANFFLDFTDAAFDNTYGIHARGCGFGSWQQADNSLTVTNITGYNDSTIYDYAPRLLAEGVDVKTASQTDIINAVENIISDEMGLEAAFEGYRFPDLVRMAQHKNASGYEGTKWLATKIADRDILKSVINNGETTGVRDESLYQKLMNPKNWFFTKPEWKNK